MKALWHTLWQGHDIAVCRDGKEVDRFDALQVERVLLLHRGIGDSPGDVLQVVIELAEECLVFSADTGIAGRINFERQAFWAERACVFWVNESRAPLPLRLRRGRWLLGLTSPVFTRVPRAELAALIERWPLQGPQTWEQRKWRRIERSRAFTSAHDGDTKLHA